jgi:hypothetical protein
LRDEGKSAEAIVAFEVQTNKKVDRCEGPKNERAELDENLEETSRAVRNGRA